ncbi:ABC transporter B family member 4-like [Sesamum indicum]|uniref:ABC transporter B family member 4-like n=1 Tax=Sesamum indicum TaxID=4182 RepID=A0A6I9THY4_SESIN|nr:ABC transporter B family member 4-like [Sesamum indicum]XP_011080371.1 ABC transporter B family member 4-like [Sesamum indicum]XP_011080372.1 ABC transporter B family member 4-like [Sesamum indicum]XP_020550805.1 ABC transporter B family member 4-like [Sesamum indicum]XP_020550807.1 ABC transporter B family member 4-like [Sesamum indicum]XP_020550808.1 ABC transporter B family member 4-like [Sesamum indicum]
MAGASHSRKDTNNEQSEKQETGTNSPSKQTSDSSSNEKTNVGKVPYHKLFSFADPADYALMVIGTITAVGSGFCLPLMTLLFGELANSFGQNAETKRVVNEVSKVSLKYVYLALGSGVAASSQVACWMITGERQAARIRNLYLRALLRQDIGYFDRETNTGEIIERMSTDAIIIQDAMGQKVGKFLQLSASFLGGFVIAFTKGWLLTTVLLSAIPLLVISAASMSVLMAKLTSKGQAAYSAAAAVVEQTLGSIRTVVSFTGERQAVVKYEKSLSRAYEAGVQEGLAAGLGSGIFMLVLFSSYALGLWFGAKMIIDKGYTGGQVLNVVMAVLSGSFSLGQVSPCLSAFAAGQVAAFKMFQTIYRRSDIDPYNMDGVVLNDINGDIELKDVHFSYPSRPDERIFNGFSLTVSSGTMLALVGQSGSGKSTVINLVERFYDPQAGEILIDGINIKEFQLRWIRGKIGLVSQEPVLFASSIKDNIAYGKDGASLEEIKAAAEHANAAKFIDQLPQGLNTMVGVNGTQLSGGQKQRIALARAILKDPRILLLDEATSALDAESERTVQEALDRVMISRTTIVVAHRLSTVKNADSVAVIHQGKVVEKGSHSELTQNPDGAYSQLVQLQEFNKESVSAVNDKVATERISSLRSISQGSSGTGNSSRNSFPTSAGLPTAANVVEKAYRESHTPPSLQHKVEHKVSLYRLACLNKPETPELVLGSLAAMVNGSILPLLGLLLSSMIKAFYEPPHRLRKDSKFWACMFVVLGMASLLATPLRTYFFAVAGCKLIKRIRLMCFEKVVHMEICWFDRIENSSSAVGSRLSADATSVRNLVGESLAILVQNISTAIAGLIIGFGASWELSLIILVMLPLIGLNGYLHMKFITGFSADTKKLYEDATQVASDAVGSIRTVASFCAEEKVMELHQEKCEAPLRLGTKQGLLSGAGFGMSLFFLYSVYAAGYYAGARLVDAGKINFGDVFRVFLGLSMTAIAISQSGALAPDSGKANAGAASVFALLDQKSRIDSSDSSGMTLENVNGGIVFQHVSFRYPNRPDVQIFEDLCLAINSGKTVAIVGESGSGKSTIISLLQRFYDPDSGQITLDGIGIQKLNLKWFRQQIGLVSQEPVLFNDTIWANIAYGKEGNANEAEVVAAAELANAHKFISGMQKGYETMVGERGIQLSGGQKQRVAIARAIVKAPKILLLDEATSALDAESEKVIQDALDRVVVDRTTIVVAHRLSTIRNADLIVVLRNGVVAEKGRHETLINKKDGVYASLVALQGDGDGVSS